MLSRSENSCNLPQFSICWRKGGLWHFLRVQMNCLSFWNSQTSFINIDNISWSMAESMHVFIFTSMELVVQKPCFKSTSCDEVTTINNWAICCIYELWKVGTTPRCNIATSSTRFKCQQLDTCNCWCLACWWWSFQIRFNYKIGLFRCKLIDHFSKQ